MHLRRLIVGGAMLLASGSSLLATTAQAHTSTCRSDPVVWLSNGHKLNLTASLVDDPSDVTSVHYDLYIPAGITVTQITYTQSWIGRLETISIYATNTNPTEYTDDAMLTTTSAGLTYTANMQIVNQRTEWNTTLTATGPTNSQLVLDDPKAQ